MDDGDIGRQLGRLEEGQKHLSESIQLMIERFDQIPGLCWDHRSKCTAAREQAETKINTRVSTLEAASAPTTVRQAWAWVQYLATLGAGSALTGYALFEIGRKLQWVP